MGFDLSQLEAADTATLDVLALTGEPLLVDGQPVRITLHGPGSEAYIKAQAKIDSAEQAKAFSAIRGKVVKEGPDAARLQRAERLAACTVRIDGLSCSPLELYSNPRVGYITNQVDRFVGDWANFLPRPASA